MEIRGQRGCDKGRDNTVFISKFGIFVINFTKRKFSEIWPKFNSNSSNYPTLKYTHNFQTANTQWDTEWALYGIL